MGLLDLFRPRWKHSDPSVRAEAIKDFSPDDLPRLAQVARHDSDPRIRRIALKKIADPDLLGEVAKNDPDEGLRRDAAEKAIELLQVVALSGEDEARSIAAVARLTTPRSLVDVACKAALSGARKAAFERLSDDRSFAEVARRGGDPELRLRAVDRLSSPESLRDLLLADPNKEIASRALGRIAKDQRELLTEVAQRAKSKTLRSAARERLGMGVLKTEPNLAAVAKNQSQAQAPSAQNERRELLCQRLEVAAKSSDPEDYADADDVLAQVRLEWQAVGGEAPSALRKRFERATSRFQERRDALIKRQQKAQPATVKVVELPPPPRREPPPEKVPEKPTEKPPEKLAEKPTEKLAEPTPDPEEVKRIAAARARREEERKQREAEQAERLRADAERREAEEKRRGEEQQANLARVEEHSARLEKLAQEETLRPKQVDQALKQAHEAMVSANPLPRERATAARQRYDAARAALVIKLHEAREREDWQRWSNVPRLEALVQKVEILAQALEDGHDRNEVAAFLKQLQGEWKAVGPAPKDKSEALWQRFKEKGDQIFEKLRSATGEERTANLAKKEALCQKVEALLASLGEPGQPDQPGQPAQADQAGQAQAAEPDWKSVGEQLKALQADWKATGPVPTKEQADALWTRFKTAADKVYTEQKGHYAELDEERAENLKKKEVLCQKAEAAVHSVDWKGTTELLKSYQADWKAIGPAPRARQAEHEALWQRFRTACDKFFERRGAAFEKLDSERLENLKKKEALCEQAEALVAKEDLDQEAGESEMKRLQGEWKRIGPVPQQQSDALWARFRGAADKVFDRGRQHETMPLPEESHPEPKAKWSHKLPLAAALAKLQSPGAGAASGTDSDTDAVEAKPITDEAKPITDEAGASSASPDPRVSDSWENETASGWEDIDRVISSQTPEPGSDGKK